MISILRAEISCQRFELGTERTVSWRRKRKKEAESENKESAKRLRLVTGSIYHSAGRHVHFGHLVRAIGEHVKVHPEANEEVLLRRLQKVLQEHDVPVQRRGQR